MTVCRLGRKMYTEFFLFLCSFPCFFVSFLGRKKFILLPSPIHFARLTSWTEFRLNVLNQTILIDLIYPLLGFLLSISPRTSGILISNFTPWLVIWCPVLEKYIMNFLWLVFHAELYLNDQFRSKS